MIIAKGFVLHARAVQQGVACSVYQEEYFKRLTQYRRQVVAVHMVMLGPSVLHYRTNASKENTSNPQYRLVVAVVLLGSVLNEYSEPL